VNLGAHPVPVGLEALQTGGGHGLGNALYLDRAAGALLKVYRPRRSRAYAWRESLHSFGHQVFEGKRGTGFRERFRTESLALRLWATHAFDVPAILERPIPPGIPDTALWLEYCPGRTLDRVVAVPETDTSVARALVERLAGEQAERHRKAIELSEPLLIEEHASIIHILVSGDRLVTIDFENAYRHGFPVEEALWHEMAGTLRSFFRRVHGAGQQLFETYVDAYPERELLRQAADRATRGGGIGRRLKRWRDQDRRNRPAKFEVMSWARARI